MELAAQFDLSPRFEARRYGFCYQRRRVAVLTSCLIGEVRSPRSTRTPIRPLYH
jgi:hypothetical protein